MSELIPAILTDQRSEVERLAKAYAGLTNWVQLDLMDGKFVESISVKIKELEDIKFNFNLEIHLMVDNPGQYLDGCQKIGVKRFIFQLEGTKDPAGLLIELNKRGIEKGIALKPETPVEMLKPYIDQLDVVLILGVNPGRQGQAMVSGSVGKVIALRNIYPDIKIEFDGGVGQDNIRKIADLGADYLVVGSAIANSKDIRQSIQDLQAALK